MDTAARQASMQDELLQMARLGFEQSVQQMPKPPAEPELVWKGLMPKLKACITSDFRPKAWLDAYAKVYAERFDEAELQGMLQFFRRRPGRLMCSGCRWCSATPGGPAAALPAADGQAPATDLQALASIREARGRDMLAQGDIRRRLDAV